MFLFLYGSISVSSQSSAIVNKIGKVALIDTVITSDVDIKSLKSADLKIETEVVNYSDKNASSIIIGITGVITFSKEIEVKASSTIKVEFTAKDFPQLTINNPKLWWPNALYYRHVKHGIARCRVFRE